MPPFFISFLSKNVIFTFPFPNLLHPVYTKYSYQSTPTQQIILRARPKNLALRKAQINLVLPSFFRNFV